jgi:hypothetical protein
MATSFDFELLLSPELACGERGFSQGKFNCNLLPQAPACGAIGHIGASPRFANSIYYRQ